MRKSRLTLAILAAQESSYYSELEREHMGCADTGTGIYHHSKLNPMGSITNNPMGVIYYELEACPACRGYNLERQWCSLCNKTGTISSGEMKGQVLDYLSPLEGFL